MIIIPTKTCRFVIIRNITLKIQIIGRGIMMVSAEFEVRTKTHTQMVDITEKVQKIVTESGIENGICMVFVPHTTAAVTINENADPDVVHDFIKETSKLVPWEDDYRHIEGNAAAHIKSSLIGFSESIIIEDGRLMLGFWQDIYFCEFDGPRRRRAKVKIIEG